MIFNGQADAVLLFRLGSVGLVMQQSEWLKQNGLVSLDCVPYAFRMPQDLMQLTQLYEEDL
jgi:hypothetical protein